MISSSPMLRRPTVGRSMPSTAATSAVPITANWTSCSGVQLTLAPRSSTVMTPPLRVGSCAAIAGRSMPGSVFSTKREIAISAPVLPGGHAGLRGLVLDQVDRDAHRRILLPAQRVAPAARASRRLRVRRGASAGPSPASAAWRAPPRARLEADGDHPRVGRLLEEPSAAAA